MTYQEALQLSDLEDDLTEDDEPSTAMEKMRKLRKAKDEYLANYNYPFCPDLSRYNLISKIGEGTFG
jgi:hypothetical protein